MKTTRFLFTAAAMPAPEARAIVELICRETSLSPYERTRRRLQRRFKSSLTRVLKFAKHETLRKMHRYLHNNRALTGAAEHPGAMRIVFNLDELTQDLAAMLEAEAPQMLENAGQSTLDSVGFRDPWQLPPQDVLDFIARRRNLLSGVPDEIHQTIKNTLSEGLTKGESLAELSDRITEAFTEIEDGRAEVIADTETAAAYSFASDKAARAAGVEYKQWLHGTSKVPRPDHLAIDRLIIPIDEPYPVGDPRLMYPHDNNGAAADVINCSCISIPVSRSEYEAQANG